MNTVMFRNVEVGKSFYLTEGGARCTRIQPVVNGRMTKGIAQTLGYDAVDTQELLLNTAVELASTVRIRVEPSREVLVV